MVRHAGAAPVRLWIVCYDIGDDRRRRQVVRILEGYGVRVLESAFECWLDDAGRRAMEARVRAVLAGGDLLRVAVVNREDLPRVRLLGCGASLSADPACWIV